MHGTVTEFTHRERSRGVRRPVQIALRDVTASTAKICAPPGIDPLWVFRLQKALGASSKSFVDVSLAQLLSATRLPNHGICEEAMNAGLALIQAVKPRDEVEGALAVQMAACHSAGMSVLGRLAGAHSCERRVATLGS